MPAAHEKSRRRVTESPAPKPSLPSHAPPAVKNGTQGGGQALDRHTNAEMSAKFGHDFSQVRIHTDARAGEAAQAVGASAFALGSDIVFGAGQYQPGSPDTDRILAHELTHVVQQSQFGPGDWGRASAGGDASEREADGTASQVLAGRSVQVGAAPQAAVARILDDNHAWNDWGDESVGLQWNSGSLYPEVATVDPGKGDALQVPIPNPWQSTPPAGQTVPTPQPSPRVPQPDPPPAFTPSPAPDPNPPYMPPPFQYTPTPFPGLGPSDPIAPFPAPPDMSQPLPPPSLFPSTADDN